MPIKKSGKSDVGDASPYAIRSVSRACEILKCFKGEQELGLDEVSRRCGLSKPTTYRLLQTLLDSQMLRSSKKNSYSLAGSVLPQRGLRFGYASQTEEFSFSRMVSESIRSFAYESGVDLLILDNCYSPRVAVRNTEVFLRERVDLVIEFQTSQQCSALVGSMLGEAGIPLIAIEVPHPGADYYGANNYRAGVIAGRALAQACLREWNGQVDEILLLELPMAGPLPHARLMGTLAGMREHRVMVHEQKIRFLDGNGRFEKSWDQVRRYLRRNRSSRILIGAVNDPSCLGALQAFEEAGRSADCLAVSQNACIEARRELRKESSRLIGSVGFFPEQYGEKVISLAIDKVMGKRIPSATFVKHRLVSRDNVNALYPNDANIPNGDSDSLVWTLH